MFWIDENVCIGCGKCVHECRAAAVTLENAIAHIDQALCIQCGVCAEVCPVDAIAERPAEQAETNQVTSSSDTMITKPANQPRPGMFAQIVRTAGKVFVEGLRGMDTGGKRQGSQRRFRGGR